MLSNSESGERISIMFLNIDLMTECKLEYDPKTGREYFVSADETQKVDFSI